MRNLSLGFPTRSDTNPREQQQKMVRNLKFQTKEVEALYYLCSENKGADQMCGYRADDLQLCFCICKKKVFSLCGLNKHDTAHNRCQELKHS